MKKNIKVFLVALIIGMITSYLIYYKYEDLNITNALESKATYFYIGSYNNLDIATLKSPNYAYAIYKENGIYKIVIGIYTQNESIDLMETYFHNQGISFNKNTMKVASKFYKDCSHLELLIKNGNYSSYPSINESILKLFNEYNNPY